ncbi:MAG: hypothetical protein K8F25_03710 [Fimbriimonadaceae bacterium]|nr:hypothetical protein [Alphaproteobacteria bacterium]
MDALNDCELGVKTECTNKAQAQNFRFSLKERTGGFVKKLEEKEYEK